MPAPRTTWAVTRIGHPALRDVYDACKECLALVDSAIAHAAVTGSVGAAMEQEDKVLGHSHSATVTRAIAVVTR